MLCYVHSTTIRKSDGAATYGEPGVSHVACFWAEGGPGAPLGSGSELWLPCSPAGEWGGDGLPTATPGPSGPRGAREAGLWGWSHTPGQDSGSGTGQGRGGLLGTPAYF